MAIITSFAGGLALRLFKDYLPWIIITVMASYVYFNWRSDQREIGRQQYRAIVEEHNAKIRDLVDDVKGDAGRPADSNDVCLPGYECEAGTPPDQRVDQ